MIKLPEQNILPTAPLKETLIDKKRCLGDKKGVLRRMGLKVTQQRLAILSALEDSSQIHLTAQDVYEKVKKDSPEIGFATVYRLLKKMKSVRFLTETKLNGMPARYEIASKDHHDHIVCVRCGKIVEFVNMAIERLQEDVALKFDFQLVDHILELYGVCSDCKDSKKNS